MNDLEQSRHSPVGAWHSSITFPDGTVQRSLVLYSQEGNVTETSTRFPARLVGIGLWRRTGDRTFEAFFEKFLFSKGEETPKVWVRVACSMTLNETGDEYTGEAKGIFMTMEREVVNTVPTRVKASRLGWSVGDV
ncbi:MAG: hypothetical protein JOZ18_15550 [Chloroflexi bacterium]|nr:hypothetical protein [Chloroflexota bacterium]